VRAPSEPLPPLELRHLRYFVAVAEELSFTRAARRLYIAQSPLSHAIRQLEAILGVSLLERSTRRVELTPAGEALLAHARVTLAQVEEAVAATRRLAPAHSSLSLRVSLDQELVVAALLAELRRRRPDLEVTLWQEGEADQLRDLQRGRVDAILVWEGFPRDPGMRALRAASLETGLAMRPDHPLAALEQVPRERLAGETLMLFPRVQAPGIYDLLVERLLGRPAPATRIVEVAPVLSAQRSMLSAVAAGGGLAPVTRATFADARPDGLVIRPLQPEVAFDVELVWRGTPSPALAELIALVETGPIQLTTV
jgi:DNA-binding transcriptional LysR family regulator